MGTHSAITVLSRPSPVTSDIFSLPQRLWVGRWVFQIFLDSSLNFCSPFLRKDVFENDGAVEREFISFGEAFTQNGVIGRTIIFFVIPSWRRRRRQRCRHSDCYLLLAMHNGLKLYDAFILWTKTSFPWAQEWKSEWVSERTSERKSEWPSTLRVYFLITGPSVRGLHSTWSKRENAPANKSH